MRNTILLAAILVAAALTAPAHAQLTNTERLQEVLEDTEQIQSDMTGLDAAIMAIQSALTDMQETLSGMVSNLGLILERMATAENQEETQRTMRSGFADITDDISTVQRSIDGIDMGGYPNLSDIRGVVRSEQTSLEATIATLQITLDARLTSIENRLAALEREPLVIQINQTTPTAPTHAPTAHTYTPAADPLAPAHRLLPHDQTQTKTATWTLTYAAALAADTEPEPNSDGVLTHLPVGTLACNADAGIQSAAVRLDTGCHSCETSGDAKSKTQHVRDFLGNALWDERFETGTVPVLLHRTAEYDTDGIPHTLERGDALRFSAHLAANSALLNAVRDDTAILHVDVTYHTRYSDGLCSFGGAVPNIPTDARTKQIHIPVLHPDNAITNKYVHTVSCTEQAEFTSLGLNVILSDARKSIATFSTFTITPLDDTLTPLEYGFGANGSSALQTGSFPFTDTGFTVTGTTTDSILGSLKYRSAGTCTFQ